MPSTLESLFPPSASKARIHTFPATGRGLQATQDIKKGDLILSVPSEYLWTTEAALKEPVLGGILKANLKDLSTDEILLVYLLFVKHSPRYTPSSSTQFHRREHHIPLLPTTYMTSYFWSTSTLSLCASTSLYQTTLQLQEQLPSDFQKLLTSLFLPHEDVFPLNLFTVKEYEWALFTIWSRCMDFKLKDDKGGMRDLRLMAPFADMANHSDDVDQCHIFDERDGSVKIVAGKDYKAGDEIYISYGPTLPLSKLALLYGFLPPSPTHQKSTYPLYLSTHPSAPYFTQKEKLFLKHLGIADASSPTPFHLNQDFEKVLTYLRVQRLGNPLELQLSTITLPGRVNSDNEFEILSALKEALEGLLSGFENQEERGEVGSEEWMAGRVRRGEEGVLKEAKRVVEERLRELK
ncbi:hypothetical protein HDV05_005742 [Chytridiales sp. JEL 0842]|nr:hypothetical protein HDV05_005742 [Chytridiales sp. JEL 0842]